MATPDLILNLLNKPGFQRQLKLLTVESVARQFPSLKVEPTLFDTAYDWEYLMLCASLLSQSQRADAQSAALRIAQHCLIAEGLPSGLKTASCVVLDTLTNRPAIELALRRNLIHSDYLMDVPLPLRMDWVQRAVRHSIVLGNNAIINANRFQRTFWDEVNENDWLSVSAPTSAGKSFLLINWLAEFLRDRPNALTVYVVPTRALIQQVQMDLEEHFAEQGPQNVNVSCLPLTTQLNNKGATVFVLTQERLHILLNNLAIGTAIDLVVVDEAQKVGDGARGVLLQIVLESVAAQISNIKFVFASPTTANPELLLEDAPQAARKRGLRSHQVTVNQNLLWVSPVPHAEHSWLVELCLSGERISLGQIDVLHRPNTNLKRLAFVTFAIGNDTGREGGGNLVYVNGAADAEKVATLLYDLIGPSIDLSGDKSVAELILLVRKAIHKQYSLATVLSRGIAFHYGNMPLIIRNEIERLFRENVLRYLVCTSTLVEGVNLPAKSIFIRGPQKGRGHPMSESDFWNLAGRAGRLGKEFQGNVICIDPYDRNAWPEPPPVERKGQQIERATDRVLGDGDKFLAYVNGDASEVSRELLPEYEHVLSYLFRHVLRHGTLKGSPFGARHSADLVYKLDEALGRIKDSLTTPIDVIARNPGISPLSMDSLLAYFTAYTKPVQELFPTLPEDTNAATALSRIFHRINKYIYPAFGTGKRVMALAILVVHWMRGYPLARIISERELLYPSQPLPAVIRGSMEDVERIARFFAPKFVACYTDLLRYFLTASGNETLAVNLPDLTLWMEFGASARTQLSLMALGLSRTSAILISEIIASDDLDEHACLRWIEAQDLVAIDLPVLVVQELRRIRGGSTTPR